MAQFIAEDFNGGTDGATITQSPGSAFTNITGTPPTFTAAAIEGAMSAHVVTSAATCICDIDFAGTPKSLVWFQAEITTPSAANAAALYIATWFSGTVKIGDMRLNPDMTLTLRSGTTAVITSPALSTGTTYTYSILCNPSSTAGHKLKVYSGTGTSLLYDSPTADATGAAVSTVTKLRLGLTTAATVDYKFDRVRADDAAEPARGSSVAATAPSAPALTATPGDGQVVLSWSIASNGGSALTGQNIQRSQASSTTGFTAIATQPSASATTITDTTAVNGTAYWYKMTATNAVGTSGVSNVTGPTTPVSASVQQQLYPAADVTTTSGVISPAGTAAVALDPRQNGGAGYVRLSTGGVEEVALDPWATPSTTSGVTVTYTLVANNAASSSVVISLLEGATVRATETRTNVPSVPTSYALAVAPSQVALIAPGAALHFKAVCTVS